MQGLVENTRQKKDQARVCAVSYAVVRNTVRSLSHLGSLTDSRENKTKGLPAASLFFFPFSWIFVCSDVEGEDGRDALSLQLAGLSQGHVLRNRQGVISLLPGLLQP